MWGLNRLAVYPLDGGSYFDPGTGSPVQYELWQMLVNLAVWTVVFAVLCIIGARRGTSRR